LLTENISPLGARVISKRSWRPGEGSLITPSTGEFAQVGRVIYCLPRAGDRFCLGIEFPDRAVNCVSAFSVHSCGRYPEDSELHCASLSEMCTRTRYHEGRGCCQSERELFRWWFDSVEWDALQSGCVVGSILVRVRH